MNNRRFVENVVFLAKKQGMKIGELEKELGLRAGYLARKRQNETDIPLRIVCHISSIFDCTVDDLLNRDFVKEAKIAELQQAVQKLNKEIEELGGE